MDESEQNLLFKKYGDQKKPADDQHSLHFQDSSASNVDSSISSDSEHRPRPRSWNIIPTFSDYQGEWEIGEQQYPEPCKSETEDTTSSESKDKSEEESATSSDALSNVYAKLSPFHIRWSFGINYRTGLINLTTPKNFEVYYASSHFGIIYNYRSNTMVVLPGHNHAITSISGDATGRWLVSADAGEDSVIIVWDNKKKIPAWSLYNVFPGGVECATISQDARFLVAISRDSPSVVKFWLWTHGRDEADGVVNVDPDLGTAVHVSFNHRKTEEFAITTELGVVFCEWKKASEKVTTSAPAMEAWQKKLGTLRETLFLEENNSALTSTSRGYVIFWTGETTPESDAGKRVFLEALRLHNVGITCMRLCEGRIVSSSEDGTIFFHDQKLRLVYWQMNLKVDPVAAISCNIEYVPLDADPFAAHFHSTNTEPEHAKERVKKASEYSLNSHTEDSKPRVTLGRSMSSISSTKFGNLETAYPTDCTLLMRPFSTRDYMLLTTTGKLGYVSHKRRKVRYFLYSTSAPLLAVDCNPFKAHVVVGDSQGRLVLYDYNQKKILLSTEFPNPITTLKFSRLGHCLIAGFQNGDLFELHALLFTVKFKFEVSKSKIEKIDFSYNDELIACYDQSSTVYVFMKKANNQWACMGTYISHYKPIVDILFEDHPEQPKTTRLFTIGQDRMLVEYDMKNLEENKLKILSVVRIEQTAVPWCFTWLYDFYKTPHFVISNDQYKLKVYDAKNHICQKTTLGPTADTPIKFMKVITEDKTAKPNMIYVTDKHIGLRLLPPTGNPFEGMGMIAHPQKVIDFAISYDHKHVFTVGANDASLLMWEINYGCLEVASQLGGVGLDPFVSLIEGGPNSFLFKEIEDFFYYAQIIHQGEDPNQDRSVSRSLALCEIPDLFRALGYYPTEYEVDNLLHELKHLNYDATGELTTEVTFDECVKAFLNHRPVYGISIDHINEALLAIADLSDPTDVIVERSELYKALEERAEAMNHEEAVGYLCILLLPKDESNPVPPAISLREFTENVLGIDLTITEENVREITHAFENKT